MSILRTPLFLRVLVATGCALVFHGLGYRIDWPTFLYTALAMVLIADVGRAPH